MEGVYEHFGPLPFKDHCGYEFAIQMVLHSRQPGNHYTSHAQYDTVIQLQTALSNQVRAPPQENWSTLALGASKGRYQREGQDYFGSSWFYRFNIGLKNRIGQNWRPNQALSIELLLQVLRKIENRVVNVSTPRERRRWFVFSAYDVICYVISLRGVEGFLLDLAGLIHYWSTSRKNYDIIPLLGKIKGESNNSARLILCVSLTSSGIDVKHVSNRLIESKKCLD